VLTQGQWWSMRAMHRPQIEQWWLAGGFNDEHFLQFFVTRFDKNRMLDEYIPMLPFLGSGWSRRLCRLNFESMLTMFSSLALLS